MPKQTKVEKLKAFIEREACWQRGSANPWEGDAIVSSWLLNRLAILAAHAPEYAIDGVIAEGEDTTAVLQ